MAENRFESGVYQLPVPPVERAQRVPFFSRLGVKHGSIVIALVLLAMAIITSLQLRETLYEIQRAAREKGRGVAGSVAPLVVSVLQKGDPKALGPYFTAVASRNQHIDYLQVVDADGRVFATNDPSSEQYQPYDLAPGWLADLESRMPMNPEGTAVPWDNEGAGMDIFVPLVSNPESATPAEMRAAKQLRVGINFDTVIKTDTPRVIYQMIVFTLIVSAVMVLGLVLLLNHVLRPLRELDQGLKAVAAGNLEYQVPVQSDDEVGRVVHAFNRTIARLRSAFDQIEAMAIRDPLTNLPNRRHFDERLAIESARSRRYGHPYGLIVLDLDKFKCINDTYGHPAGDEVLKSVARVIERSVRETDLPARIGGEEFAVLLPETGPGEVLSVAEKLRHAVAEMAIEPKSGMPENLRITVSAGAACVGGQQASPEASMSVADAALYRSKNEGRNRVTMAEPEIRETLGSGTA